MSNSWKKHDLCLWMADPGTEMPDYRAVCTCCLLIHRHNLFLTLLLLQWLCKVFPVISTDKTTPVKGEVDQYCISDYATHSFIILAVVF